MRERPRGTAARIARAVVIGAVAAGGTAVAAPSASASHACGGTFDDYEICFFRLSGYSGGSRAFTSSDTTYANDNYTGTSTSLNNTISAYYNYHPSRWYTVCRYVSQEGCYFTIREYQRDSDLGNNTWTGGSVGMDNTYSSHVYNNA
ncbi:hypothetical protein ACGFNU_11455 [Spirillospora sp. NPDC048911]|uniref:hypothetical protein n=1 Tax=Spirillospora sp. NPDC048911 TaxID=3364527 RepID=UPI00371F928B